MDLLAAELQQFQAAAVPFCGVLLLVAMPSSLSAPGRAVAA